MLTPSRQNLLPNRVFAEFEFFTGVLKISITFIVLFVMLMICSGYGGKDISRGHNFQPDSAFPNGFSGIAAVFLLASWATGGQELIGIASGESEFPRWDLPRACKFLLIRLFLIYLSASVYIVCSPRYWTS